MCYSIRIHCNINTCICSNGLAKIFLIKKRYNNSMPLVIIYNTHHISIIHIVICIIIIIGYIFICILCVYIYIYILAVYTVVNIEIMKTRKTLCETKRETKKTLNHLLYPGSGSNHTQLRHSSVPPLGGSVRQEQRHGTTELLRRRRRRRTALLSYEPSVRGGWGAEGCDPLETTTTTTTTVPLLIRSE